MAPALTLLKLAPHSADSAFGVALIYSLLHRDADAVKAFDLVQPENSLGKAMVAAGRLVYQSVLNPKLHAQALAAVDALRRRADLDPSSMSDLVLLDLVLGEKKAALDLLPQVCAASPVGCSDLGVNPGWLPLHGDPCFEALVKKYDITSQPPATAASAPSSP